MFAHGRPGRHKHSERGDGRWECCSLLDRARGSADRRRLGQVAQRGAKARDAAQAHREERSGRRGADSRRVVRADPVRPAAVGTAAGQGDAYRGLRVVGTIAMCHLDRVDRCSSLRSGDAAVKKTRIIGVAFGAVIFAFGARAVSSRLDSWSGRRPTGRRTRCGLDAEPAVGGRALRGDRRFRDRARVRGRRAGVHGDREAPARARAPVHVSALPPARALRRPRAAGVSQSLALAALGCASAAAFDGWLKRIMITDLARGGYAATSSSSRASREDADFGSHARNDRRTNGPRRGARDNLPPNRGSALCSRTTRACRIRRSPRSLACRSARSSRTSRAALRACGSCWSNTKESRPWIARRFPMDDDDRRRSRPARAVRARAVPRHVTEQPFVNEVARRVAASQPAPDARHARRASRCDRRR